MATAISVSDASSIAVGTRLYASQPNNAHGPLLQTGWGALAMVHVAEALRERRSRVVSLTGDGGEVEVFIEAITPALPLLIFGAGHDALPLVQVSKGLGWHVTLADGRPSYAQARRFPAADRVLLTEPDDLFKGACIGEGSVAVVMNHSYAIDREIVARLLAFPMLYIGILGPRARTEKMFADLGVKEIPACVHAPIGLDIGADTPEGIALSIAAEIQAAVAGREGGKLRVRREPIYPREEPARPAARPFTASA